MVVKLYTTEDDNNKVTKVLDNEKTLSNVTVRGESDIMTPHLLIQSTENLSGYNYLYIERYGRYYFIDKIVVEATNCWRLSCRVDVLMTYGSEIRELTGTIKRQAYRKDGYLIDNEYVARGYKQVVTKQFPNQINGDTIILMTTG